MEHKKTICVDFDGVINQYDSGWKGADVISDPPVEGAIKGLYRLVSDEEVDVAIHSTRSGQEGGIKAMRKWLNKWDAAYREAHDVPADIPFLTETVRFPVQKPPAMVYIDDRGFYFDGDWSKITAELKDFTPWNKRQCAKLRF